MIRIRKTDNDRVRTHPPTGTAHAATRATTRAATLAAALLAGPALAQDATTLTVAMHYSQDQAAPLIECFRRYEEANPGIAVEYQQLSYRDYLQTVLTSRLGGQAPDIYHLYSIWGAQMVDNGVLATPPAEIETFIRDTYAESTVDAASIDGTLYGVPSEVSAYMLVSNMALLREAGYDAPPTTWDELREIASAVTTRNEQGRIETAGFAFADSTSGTVHPFLVMLSSEGVDAFTEGFEGTNLASPEAIDVVGKQAALVADGVTDASVDGFDFPAGGIGMIIMANWLEADIRAGFGDRFGEDVAVSAIPMGEDWRTLQYAFFYGVDSGSENQDEAWDLIAYVNGPESAATEGGPSCTGAMLNDLGALTANAADLEAIGEQDAFTRPFIDAINDGKAVSEPNVIQSAEIQKLMSDTIRDVRAGDADATEAMGELDESVSDVLAEFY